MEKGNLRQYSKLERQTSAMNRLKSQLGFAKIPLFNFPTISPLQNTNTVGQFAQNYNKYSTNVIFDKSLQKSSLTITCGVLFLFGDYIAQKVESKLKQSWDHRRSINFAIVGMMYYGPSLHLWYCKILPIFAGIFFKKSTKIKRVLGSLLFDQILFSPIFYCGYYIADAIVENKSLSNGLQIGIQLIRDKIIETLIADIVFWPLATGINLYYVPLQYQVLFVSFVCLFWDVVLCKITKKQKESKI